MTSYEISGTMGHVIDGNTKAALCQSMDQLLGGPVVRWIGPNEDSSTGGGSTILPQESISGVSLTTKGFKWLHQGAWEAPAVLAYESLHAADPVGLFSPPAFSRRKKSPSQLTHLGRWVLLGADDEVLAAAEAQMIATSFRTVWLFVGSHKAGWSSPSAYAQLSLLISGLILTSRADRLLVARWNHGNDQDLLQFSSTGEVHAVWSPMHSLMRLAGSASSLRIQTVVVDPAAWWLSEQGAADRQQLSYLERRTAALESQKPAAKKNSPRRRSLFRPWG